MATRPISALLRDSAAPSRRGPAAGSIGRAARSAPVGRVPIGRAPGRLSPSAMRSIARTQLLRQQTAGAGQGRGTDWQYDPSARKQDEGGKSLWNQAWEIGEGIGPGLMDFAGKTLQTAISPIRSTYDMVRGDISPLEWAQVGGFVPGGSLATGAISGALGQDSDLQATYGPAGYQTGQSVRRTGERVGGEVAFQADRLLPGEFGPGYSPYARAWDRGEILGTVMEDIGNAALVAGGTGRALGSVARPLDAAIARSGILAETAEGSVGRAMAIRGIEREVAGKGLAGLMERGGMPRAAARTAAVGGRLTQAARAGNLLADPVEALATGTRKGLARAAAHPRAPDWMYRFSPEMHRFRQIATETDEARAAAVGRAAKPGLAAQGLTDEQTRVVTALGNQEFNALANLYKQLKPAEFDRTVARMFPESEVQDALRPTADDMRRTFDYLQGRMDPKAAAQIRDVVGDLQELSLARGDRMSGRAPGSTELLPPELRRTGDRDPDWVMDPEYTADVKGLEYPGLVTARVREFQAPHERRLEQVTKAREKVYPKAISARKLADAYAAVNAELPPPPSMREGFARGTQAGKAQTAAERYWALAQRARDKVLALADEYQDAIESGARDVKALERKLDKATEQVVRADALVAQRVRRLDAATPLSRATGEMRTPMLRVGPEAMALPPEAPGAMREMAMGEGPALVNVAGEPVPATAPRTPGQNRQLGRMAGDVAAAQADLARTTRDVAAAEAAIERRVAQGEMDAASAERASLALTERFETALARADAAQRGAESAATFAAPTAAELSAERLHRPGAPQPDFTAQALGAERLQRTLPQLAEAAAAGRTEQAGMLSSAAGDAARLTEAETRAPSRAMRDAMRAGRMEERARTLESEATGYDRSIDRLVNKIAETPDELGKPAQVALLEQNDRFNSTVGRTVMREYDLSTDKGLQAAIDHYDRLIANGLEDQAAQFGEAFTEAQQSGEPLYVEDFEPGTLTKSLLATIDTSTDAGRVAHASLQADLAEIQEQLSQRGTRLNSPRWNMDVLERYREAYSAEGQNRLDAATERWEKARTNQVDRSINRSADKTLRAMPARFAPAAQTARRAIKALLDEADELDRTGGRGAGDYLREMAEDIPNTVLALVDEGVDPVHLIGGIADVSARTGTRPAGGGSLRGGNLKARSARSSGLTARNLPDYLHLEASEGATAARNEAAKRIEAEIGSRADVEMPDMAGRTPSDAFADADKLGLAPVTGDKVFPDTQLVPKVIRQALDNSQKAPPTVLRGIAKANRFVKRLLLPWSPRWHMGNIVGNGMMGAVFGGVSPVEIARTAADVKRQLGWKGMFKAGGIPEGLPTTLATSGTTMSERLATGMGTQDLNPRPKKGEKGRVPKMVRHQFKKWERRSYQFNEMVDGIGRTSVYMSGLRKGLTAEGAAKLALKSMGNYNKMTPFERRYVREVVPFYPWLRHQTVAMMRLPIDSPTRAAWLGGLGYLMSQDEEKMELYKLMGVTVPLGGDRVLPLSSLNPFPNPTELPLLSPSALPRAVSPLVKLPAAALFGWDVGDMSEMSRPPGTGNIGPYGNKKATGLWNRPGELAYVASGYLPQTRALRDQLGGGKVRYDTGQPVTGERGLTKMKEGAGLGQNLATLFGIPWPTPPRDVEEARRRREEARG